MTYDKHMDISIHAPARGATGAGGNINEQDLAFQSTLPQGERLPEPMTRSITSNFNPRSRKGSDLRAAPKDGMIILFQSTLPQGERPPQADSAVALANFNPRSRKGSDGGALRPLRLTGGFQSTLPQGERHREGHRAASG